MSVFQQIPPPSSSVVDPSTGQITGLWYNYLVNFGSAVSGFLLSTNNLSDVGNVTTARNNLGALGVTGAATITTLGTIVTGTWNATTIGTIYGGTGLTSYTQGDLIYASAANTLSKLAKDANATRYLSNTGTSNNPAWAQVNLANGVTGSLPTSSLSGTIALASQVSGDLPFANLTQGSAKSVLGVTGNATADMASIAGTTNQVLRVDTAGTGLSFGAINLASSSAVTGTLVIGNGGTGVASTTAYAVLCGGTTSTAALQSIASVGTSGQVLTSNGAGALPTFQDAASSGKPIVQQVYTISGTVATGTTTIPADNTIPQNSEGTQFITLAITPTDSSNLLLIEAQILLSTANAGHLIMALFQDTTANALSTIDQYQTTATGMLSLHIKHIMVAGTTSSTTFKIRGGSNIAGTTTFNGGAGLQQQGGTMNSYIHIQEITV